MDLSQVIMLVERFRANGLLFTDGGVVQMLRDAALEAGFVLRVIRARTVPIKKSNPGLRRRYGSDAGRPLTARRRYIDKGKDQQSDAHRLAGLAGMPLQQAERPIGQSFQVPIDMSPHVGEDFGIDAGSYEQWGALAVDEPMRIGAQDLRFDDHDSIVQRQRLVLASNPTRTASYGGVWYGQRFIRWPWKSDAIFAECLDEEAQDLRDAWSLREAINALPRSLARVKHGEAFLLPGRYKVETGRRQAVRITNVGATSPKSRVPEFLRETSRLDGRRR